MNYRSGRRLQFWCKNTSQCYRLKDKIPELSKGVYVNCCDFFCAEDFVGQNWCYVAQLYTSSISEIFLITMPQEARKRKSRGGTSMWASKWTLQASVPIVHCLQTNEKLRDKMHIHLGCSITTHSRAKLVSH